MACPMHQIIISLLPGPLVLHQKVVCLSSKWDIYQSRVVSDYHSRLENPTSFFVGNAVILYDTYCT